MGLEVAGDIGQQAVQNREAEAIGEEEEPDAVYVSPVARIHDLSPRLTGSRAMRETSLSR